MLGKPRIAVSLRGPARRGARVVMVRIIGRGGGAVKRWTRLCYNAGRKLVCVL